MTNSRDDVQKFYNKLFKKLDVNNLLEHYEIIDEARVNDLNYISWCLDNTDKKLLLGLDSNPNVVTQYTNYVDHPRIKILSGNIEYLFQDSKYVYFPYFFVTQLFEENFQTTQRHCRFGFLSRQPRPHRLYLYQKTKKYITKDDCFAVHANFLEKFNYNGSYSSVSLTTDLPYYTNNALELEYIKHFQEDNSTAGDHTNKHNACSSYFYITGESSDIDNFVFLSEKTWKGIRSYCMPITYGNIGTKKALTQLGFVLEYDIDASCLDKAEWIASIMKNWDMDYCKTFYNQNFEIVKHNFERFYSKNLRQLFVDHVKLKLEL